MPATSKFDLINDALSNTANNLAEEADLTAAVADQTLEWRKASAAYDRELPLLLERHTWPFARTTEGLEQADEDDNPSNRYGYAYDWPYLCLWLEKVEAPGGLPIPYEIIGRYICMDYDGEDDDAPVATFVQTPLDKTTISNLFWEVLTRKVEVSILRSINEDYGEAKSRDGEVEAILLPLVRTRTDQQKSTRKAFRSTMRERRASGGGPRLA